MAVFDFFKLSLFLNLLSTSNYLSLLSPAANNGGHVSKFPPTCSRIECPSYDVIYTGDDYEIRRYNSSMWISTKPIDTVDIYEAGRIGFRQLFAYIQGKNDKNQKIEMTGPVMIEVKPSDGPFCGSSWTVSFYVPKENQLTVPSADGLHLQKWGLTYVAVRQFGGYVKDVDVDQEAVALDASLAGTVWADAIHKSHVIDCTSDYIVAQYNSPFQFRDRVNEIWFTFYM